MNANLLVRLESALNRINRKGVYLFVAFFFSFLTFGLQAYADDQVILIIHDPAPVCGIGVTVDLTLPAVTAGSTPGLTYKYFSDPGLKSEIPDPTKVVEGTYYIMGNRVSPVGIVVLPIHVVISPPSIGGKILGASEVCLGSTSGLLTLTGQTGMVVKWQSSVSPFSSWTDISNTATTYTSGFLTQATQFRVVVKSGICAEAISDIATISISPLSVSGTISGGLEICAGSAGGVLTLSGHTGNVVKWQSSVSPFSTWTDIANTTATYTSGFLAKTTHFRAVVQSGSCPAVNSASAIVTVDPASVGGNVTGGSTICTGSVSGVLTLSGHTGAVIKWQSSVDPFSSWTDISNTATTYTSGVLTQTTKYRAVVQSGSCPSVNSGITTVSVSPATIGGTVSGSNILCTGSTSGVLTLSGQTGTVVKWQSSVSPFTTWTDILNTTVTYTSGNLTQTTQFRAVVQSGNCIPVNSLPATVTISPKTVGGSVTGGASICTGSPSGLLTLSGQTGTVVKWQSSVSPFNAWTDISNTGTTYTSGFLTQTTQFRAVVQSGNCAEANSSPATVTVSPATVGGSVSGGASICIGSKSGVLTLSGHIGTVIKWQSSVLPFSTWTDIANTATTYTSGVLTQTTQFRAVVQSGSCTIVNSDFSTITILPATVGGAVSGGTTICSGSTSALLTLSGQTGNVVKWQSSVAPFSIWSDIANTTNTYTSGTLTQTTQFRAVVQSGSCPAVNSVPATVTVDPTSVGGNITGGTTICTGSVSGVLTLSGHTGSVVKWQSSVAPFTSWTDILNTATTYTSGVLTETTQYRAVIQSGSCPVIYSDSTTVTISPVTVGGTVSGGTTICSGGTSDILTLSGQTGTVVKWQSSVSPFTTWTDILNTTVTYTSGNLTQTTQFRAVVQSGGCPADNSSITTVTVDPASIGGNIAGGKTICTGSASGILTLSGQTGNVVKWQSSVTPFNTWIDIANTLTTYTSGIITETTQFRAVVQSGNCSTENSLPATVTVSPVTVGGAVSGGTKVCSAGTSGLLTLSGHTGSVVKWQSSVAPFNTWTDILNATATYTSGALTQETQFRAVVQSGNCPIAYSNFTTVTISPVSIGGTVSGGTTICASSTSSLLTLSGQTGNVVKWQSSVAPFSSWTDIVNTTTAYTSGVLTQTTQFRAVIQSGSCPAVNSVPATVTVDPTSVGGNITGGTTICTGSVSGVLTLSGHTGAVVKWQSSVAPFTSWNDISNASTTYTSGVLTETTQYRAVIQSGSCPVIYSDSATITISPLTVGGTVSGGTTICSGGTSDILTLSGQTGTVVKWQSSVAPFTTWIDIINTATNYTSAALTQTTQFRAVVQSGGCPAVNSTSTLVTVVPTSAGGNITGGTTICTGSASGILTLSGQTGNVVKWQSSVSPFNTWIDIANALTTYTSGILTETTQYRAVVQSGSCPTENSLPGTVTVSPATVGGTVSGSTTICTGSTSDVLTLSGHTGSVVKWQSSVAPFSVWTDIANTEVTYTSGVLTQDTQFRCVVQSGNCLVENSLFATVTVLPASVGGIVSGGTTICSGSVSGLLTLSGQTGNVVKWQSSVSPFSTWTDISNTTTAYTSGALTDTTQFRVVVQSGNCAAVNSASTLVTVTPTVSVPEFSLGATSTRCQGAGSVTYTATATNTTGLTYSLDAASLNGGNTVDAVSGQVTYVAGWNGTSIITVNATGCNGPAIAAHSATVTSTPLATISYQGPVCNADLTPLPVVLTGSTDGVFSAPEGLKIDASNGSIIPGLSASGTYTVSYSIAASGGCSAYSNSTQVQIFGIPVLESIEVRNVTCTGSADGSFVAKAAGTETFIYEWTGPTSYTNTGSGINGLAPGIYTLKVTNTNGCFILTKDTIRESAIPLSLALVGANPSKSNVSDGKIGVDITGGTQPSNYLWTGPDAFTSMSQNLVGLKYGTYNLQVTDRYGCVKSGAQILIDPPTAVDDTISTIEDLPLTFDIVSNDTDNDGTIVPSTIDLDPSTLNQQTTFEVPGKGAFTVSATGEVTFTPFAHFMGLATIQYVVMDNKDVFSNLGKITVTVKSNNKQPIAIDDNFTVAEHNTGSGNVKANDSDPEGEPLTLGSFTIGSNSYLPGETATIAEVGTIVIILDGTFTFIPFQHYNGSVPQVTYIVIDSEGLSASANLYITVSPVNDTPMAVDDNITTMENEKVEGNILNNDYDIESDAIVLNTQPIVAPEHGKLVLSANGDFIYQPIMDFIGNDKFTYQICDNVTPSLCSIATVTIVITKNDSCEIFVPNVFTPNADGVHDYLKIRCLYLYDNPEMQIFNRNGNLIFKKDHYGNLDFWGSEDEAFWNGRSENKWNLMNDVLPVGTYYYILKLGDGKVLTGFIFLGK